MASFRAYNLRLLCIALASAIPMTAQANGISEEWPVDLGIDCSLDIPCEKLHLDRWDRPTCIARIIARQRKEPQFSEKYESSDKYFQRLPNGSLANTAAQMTVTLEGCATFCGEGTWYWDAIPRLTTWIIPVLLLLSNIELSPIDKHRFATIIHAVGDPIDSFWSLLHKIYVWRRLHAMAVDRCEPRAESQTWWTYTALRWSGRKKRWKRWWGRWWQRLFGRWFAKAARGRQAEHAPQPGCLDGDGRDGVRQGDGVDDDEEFDQMHDRVRVIATVLAGFEEISGAYIETELRYTMVLNQLGHIGHPSTQSGPAWHEWRQCARRLADARTNEFLRTLLAIFIYIFGVVAALDDDVGGGNTSRPGGRIGSAVFLMWLVPLALFSNVIGTFTSRRTCLTIMRLFVQNSRVAVGKANQSRGGGQGNEPRPPQEPPAASPPSARGRSASFAIPSPAISGSLSATLGTGDGVVSGSAAVAAGTGAMSGAAAPATLLLGSSSRRLLDLPRPSRRSRPANRNSSRRASLSRGYESSDAVELESVRETRGRAHQRQRHSSADRVDPLAITNSVDFAASEGSSARASGSQTPLPARTDDTGSSNSRATLIGSPIQNLHDFRFPDTDGRPLAGPTSAPRDPATSGNPEPQQGNTPSQTDGQPALIPIPSWTEYFHSLHWLGAVYTYRPWKLGYRSVRRKSAAHYASNWFLYLLSLFPIVVSAVGAFVIMWYAVPVGWSCRHIWVVGLTLAWLLSNLFTIWLHNDKIKEKEVHKNDVPSPSSDPNHTEPNPAPNLTAPPTPRINFLAETTETSPRAGSMDAILLGHSPHTAHGRSHDGNNHTSAGPDSDNLSNLPPTLPSSWWRRPFNAACRACVSTWRYFLGPGRWSERKRWYVLLVKDAIIGAGGVAVVLLSTSGVFNNCWCWSAYMWHWGLPGDQGREAFVPLTTEDEYNSRADIVYWPVVWTSLSLQLAFFFGIVFIWWDGITVVRWNESRRRREWRHELLDTEEYKTTGDTIVRNDANYLLFWYDQREFDAEVEDHMQRRRSTFSSPRSVRGGSLPTQQDGGSTPSRPTARPRSRSFLANNPERTPTLRMEEAS